MSAEHPFAMSLQELEFHLRVQHPDEVLARRITAAIRRHRLRRLAVEISRARAEAPASAPTLNEAPGQEPQGRTLAGVVNPLDSFPCVECSDLLFPAREQFVLLSDGWRHGRHFAEQDEA